jgi:cellulose synthase/poly-beta-1,6-N-acetylglucosamine synthase-like glycosyltransferase
VWIESLSAWELAAPTLFVVATFCLLGPMLPLRKPWARALIVALVGIVVARYLSWRLLETVWPADGSWYEVGWIWFCFAVELLALLDLSILYLTFLRVTDRRPEADRHEARLRAVASDQLPWVDVFIPTYNEPFAVLEKTVTGALCLDYPNFRLWVLDDGRRAWLKEFCEAKGIGYLTRPDNAHAKAGNINHALTKTNAEFVAVFDADFIPQRNFLLRTLGFFSDPKVGIVQAPHAFYNNDPMQANLALRRALPHDQSLFFESIMPSRDGWDAAFCCGSNSVIRRAALCSVGNGFPVESITEDILLTLTLLQRGYVTRYLCERLAYGLAPESIDAFFVQRQRWARGGIQTLFLASGPFGRGLTFVQRLMFLPTHWLSQSPALMLALVAPLVFFWTGILPFVHVTTEAEIYYFFPTIIALMAGIWVFAPAHFSPLAAYVLGTFQSFRLLPHVVQTFVRPFGHIFKVTPKGQGSGSQRYALGIFWMSATLIVLTVAGLIINTIPELQIAPAGLLPIAASLAALNVVVLFFVCMLSLQAPVRRGEERFRLDEPVLLFSGAGARTEARTRDISLSGVGIIVADRYRVPALGEKVRLHLAEVGFVAGSVTRGAGNFVGIEFDLPVSLERDLLIRKLFTAGRDAVSVSTSALAATVMMLKAVWSHRSSDIDAGGISEVDAQNEIASKLPARSLVIAPRHAQIRLAEIDDQRRRVAA